MTTTLTSTIGTPVRPAWTASAAAMSRDMRTGSLRSRTESTGQSRENLPQKVLFGAVGVVARVAQRRSADARRSCSSPIMGRSAGFPVAGAAVAEHDQVVAVHDLAAVFGAELPGQPPGGAAHQVGDLRRVVVDQAAGDEDTVLVPQVHGVARVEIAFHFDDPR